MHYYNAPNIVYWWLIIAFAAACHPINKETLGPLERTIYRGKERPGQHFPTKGEVAPGAFSATYGKASRVDPQGTFPCLDSSLRIDLHCCVT